MIFRDYLKSKKTLQDLNLELESIIKKNNLKLKSFSNSVNKLTLKVQDVKIDDIISLYTFPLEFEFKEDNNYVFSLIIYSKPKEKIFRTETLNTLTDFTFLSLDDLENNLNDIHTKYKTLDIEFFKGLIQKIKDFLTKAVPEFDDFKDKILNLKQRISKNSKESDNFLKSGSEEEKQIRRQEKYGETETYANL